MAVFKSSQLELPDEILDPWLGKVKFGSSIATLSASEPMKFGTGSWMTFDIGEAEYVGEGTAKGPSTITTTRKKTKPFKFHKTVRWTEEVKWADEDHQLDAVNQILALIQPSLSRALDFGVYHGINPTGGVRETDMTEYLAQTTNSVEVDSLTSPQLYIDAADELVLADRFNPKDVALDPAFAAAFGKVRAPLATGEPIGPKMYPDLSYATAPAGRLENHNSSVSDTVGAVGVAEVDTNVLGFDGDFSAIRWGIQRAIGLEMIEYGDPDGQGDLKRNNEVAFRAEVVYGWGIADLSAFAKFVQAVSDEEDD